MSMSFAEARAAMTSNAAYSTPSVSTPSRSVSTPSRSSHVGSLDAAERSHHERTTSRTSPSGGGDDSGGSRTVTTSRSSHVGSLDATERSHHDRDRDRDRDNDNDNRVTRPSTPTRTSESDGGGQSGLSQALSIAAARQVMTSDAAYRVETRDDETRRAEERFEAMERMRAADAAARSRIERETAWGALSERALPSVGSARAWGYQGRLGDGIMRVGDDMNALDALAHERFVFGGSVLPSSRAPGPIPESGWSATYDVPPDFVIAQNQGTGWFGTNFGMRPENRGPLTDALRERGTFWDHVVRFGAGVEASTVAPVGNFFEDVWKGYVVPSNDRGSVFDEPGAYYRESLSQTFSGLADAFQVGSLAIPGLSTGIEYVRGNDTVTVAAEMGQGMIDAARDDPLEFAGAIAPALLGSRALPVGRRTTPEVVLTSPVAPVARPPALPPLGLLPDEALVGTAAELRNAGRIGDDITPHHIPSANRMAAEGVSWGDGIAINMEQPSGPGGRHRSTLTYGTRADADMSLRDALAAGLWDARSIYQRDGLYGDYVRDRLREVIERNRTEYPDLFE
ncbi:MAG: hypothetical protein AAF718_00380 [Pseudomonadota bacterium]